MWQIFINYRRDDSAGHAGRLADSLTRRFGKGSVFFDVHIPGGESFVREIERAVGACDVLLAVIGRRWLTIREEATGQRRLDDPRDYLRLEIELALARGVRVIPVLVQGAGIPVAAELPESLRGLVGQQAVVLSDDRWDYDVGRLVKAFGRSPRRSGRTRALLGIGTCLALFALLWTARQLRRGPAPSPRPSMSGPARAEKVESAPLPAGATSSSQAPAVSHAGAKGPSTAPVAPPAKPGRPSTTAAAQKVEVVPGRDYVELYADAQGRSLALVVPHTKQPGLAPTNLKIYYGDGRRFEVVEASQLYVPRAGGAEARAGAAVVATLCDRRSRICVDRMVVTPASAAVECDKGKVTFARIAADEARSIVTAATFWNLHKEWVSVALGRNSAGTYTYVADAHAAWRILVGAKGDMREVATVPLSEIPHDADLRDVVLPTPLGELHARRVVTPEDDYYQLSWQRSGQTQLLTALPVDENWRLIFEQLGVFPRARFYSPCDALDPP